MTKERALENCRMLARREINRIERGKANKLVTLAAWKHILRFCDEAQPATALGLLREEADNAG